jgi:signal transduction histidine kinase
LHRTPDFGASPAVLLHLLQRGLPCDVAFIGSVEGDRLVVEEAWPGTRDLIGARLRLPAGLLEEGAVILDTASIRLPLDWTQLCGGRPAYVAAAPVEAGATCLVLVSRAGPHPVTAELEEVAAMIARLLSTGQRLRRARDTSEWMRVLVDHLPAPVVFVDSREGDVFLNDPARVLLDVEGGVSQHMRVAAALRTLVASANGNLPALLLVNPRTDLTLDLLHRDRHYEVESRWIEEDRLTGRLWMFHDVTNERDAARFKDELVSNVSHELRTPLTSIIGALGLLKSGAVVHLPEAATGLVDIAHNNAERLGRLVNDLLVMGRLEADRLEMQLERTNICALLVEAVALNRPYADRFDVTLELSLPEEPLFALVDGDRLVQVMGNLLSNAIKFSPVSGVVRIVLAREGSRVRISVVDHGRGMSAEFQRRLFSRFEQERKSDAPRSGTGLGLAISKGIVERLHGRIYVVSKLKSGSTFHVDLPVES